MSHAPPTSHARLLAELVRGLSAPGSDPHRSVGLVANPDHPPQPPRHCLRTCLGDDPGAIATRGCDWLKAAAENRLATTDDDSDDGVARHAECVQGYRVAASPTQVGRTTAVLITVEGQPVDRAHDDASGPDLLGHLDDMARLVTGIDQLVEENAGFANEVLQNYEHLNLIFDLTQQIAQVTDAGAIERLLVDRVVGLLGGTAAWVIRTDETRVGYGTDGASDGELPLAVEDLAEVVHTVRRMRQVQVSAVAGGGHTIAGPLVRLDDEVDVVLVSRPEAAGTFSSGDMMLIESVLAFGGQIISNTELHERLRRMSLEVTRAMVAAIDKKDHYTSGHSERVGLLTRLTAAELGVPAAEQQVMEWAGLLHDVGKIGIPEDILCKPGKLTREEFEVIKQHPRMGYEILQPIASLGVILDGVLYHHEYPDGSGYPEGLEGEAIPLVARIIHVADTFDALTSTRSYRKAFSVARAFEIIKEEKGVRIDGMVADAFMRAFERYGVEEAADFAERFGHIRGAEVPV